jgi:hypothetical protein
MVLSSHLSDTKIIIEKDIIRSLYVIYSFRMIVLKSYVISSKLVFFKLPFIPFSFLYLRINRISLDFFLCLLMISLFTATAWIKWRLTTTTTTSAAYFTLNNMINTPILHFETPHMLLLFFDTWLILIELFNVEASLNPTTTTTPFLFVITLSLRTNISSIDYYYVIIVSDPADLHSLKHTALDICDLFSSFNLPSLSLLNLLSQLCQIFLGSPCSILAYMSTIAFHLIK